MEIILYVLPAILSFAMCLSIPKIIRLDITGHDILHAGLLSVIPILNIVLGVSIACVWFTYFIHTLKKRTYRD